MIKISKLADYSIHIVHALMHETVCVSAAKIAKQTMISEPTVSKVLKKLANAHLLISEQGATGGYKLAKSAELITLAELITAIDGKPAMTECCKIKYDCAREHLCSQKTNWRKINQMVYSVLEGISLRDMNESSTASLRNTTESSIAFGSRATASAKKYI